MRRACAIAVSLIVAAWAPGVWPDMRAGARARQNAPNILLIQADDLGYGDLSSYGQSRFQTPSLDAIASRGIRFTHYYAGSTVCAPSRAALMTGLHTGHAWVRGNGEIPLREEDVTVAMALRAAGYRTAVIGKWGLGVPGTTGQPDRKGFDYSFGFLDHRHAHRQFTDHLYRNAERLPVDVGSDYVNDLFTREAEAFISRDDQRPFFIYLNYTVPHAELRLPDEALSGAPVRFPEEKPYSNAQADGRPAGWQDVSLGYRSQPAPRTAFAAMIQRMDRDIGRLVDLLRQRGIEERTLVMFVSDNGPHQEGGADPVFFKSSGGLRGIKRDLYEGGIRVPMIAQWPGTIPAGQVSAAPWAHWDMFPTLADLAGASTPPGLDGRSMARVLRGDRGGWHEPMYWEFHERGFQQAARMGDWKAIRLKKDAPLELYNLATDPAEATDVARTHPEVVAKMEAYLRSARTESQRWPIK